MPLSAAQLAALARCTARQLTWGQRMASRALATWRERAARIPEPTLREAALHALATKRGHADGAALFSALVPRNAGLVGTLVAYQTIWDGLDSLHELAPDERNGRQLHLAVVDALDLDQRPRSYFLHCPYGDDGGYVRDLVDACRRGVATMPAYHAVLGTLRPHLASTDALALNHLDPGAREAALRRWAAVRFPEDDDLAWFERSAAASASLVQHALVAAASRATTTEGDATVLRDVYWPWPSLTATMLDSLVDHEEDLASGSHSYVQRYGDLASAVDRIEEAIHRSAQAALSAPDGHRHAVIVACMIAMYLSRDSAWRPPLRAATTRLLNAGGALTRALAPVLRAWRIYYRHQAA
jgi:tetraprenyl-beta-curcumene synthase